MPDAHFKLYTIDELNALDLPDPPGWRRANGKLIDPAIDLLEQEDDDDDSLTLDDVFGPEPEWPMYEEVWCPLIGHGRVCAYDKAEQGISIQWTDGWCGFPRDFPWGYPLSTMKDYMGWKGKAVYDHVRAGNPASGSKNNNEYNNEKTAGAGNSAPNNPRFKLRAFGSLEFKCQSTYLVKRLVPQHGLVVVWGPPKCGKSFWAFDLTMHVAMGRQYRGRRVKQGPVVYCAFEGADGFAGRKQAFLQRNEVPDDVPFYLVSARMDMAKDHGVLITDIRQQIGTTAPAIVVLDTLNRSLDGSESKDGDMAGYVKATDAIRETFGCVVMVIHHCGVEGSRPRGHTSLTGAADAQLAVKKDGTGNVLVTVEYMKDGPEGDVLASKLEVVPLGQDEDGDDITSCVVVPTNSDGTPQQSKVSGAADIALRMLKKALFEVGSLPPASNHIPPNTRTCSTDQWRQYCYLGTITESTNPDSKQKAFVRASKQLQALGIIGVWNDQVWVTGHAGHSRT